MLRLDFCVGNCFVSDQIIGCTEINSSHVWLLIDVPCVYAAVHGGPNSPQSLQDLLGLETILQRLPDDYLRAVFGYYLASRYIYLKGTPPGLRPLTWCACIVFRHYTRREISSG